MDHRLMMGMFIGGVVMMTPPVLLGIAVGVYVLRQQRQAAGSPSAEAAAPQEGGS